MAEYLYCDLCDEHLSKKSVDKFIDDLNYHSFESRVTINGRTRTTKIVKPNESASAKTMMVSREEDGYYCYGKTGQEDATGLDNAWLKHGRDMPFYTDKFGNKIHKEPHKMRIVEAESHKALTYGGGAILAVCLLGLIAIMALLPQSRSNLMLAGGMFIGMLVGGILLMIGYWKTKGNVKEAVEKKDKYGFQPEQQRMDSYEDMQQSRQPRQPRQPSRQTEDSERKPPPPPPPES